MHPQTKPEDRSATAGVVRRYSRGYIRITPTSEPDTQKLHTLEEPITTTGDKNKIIKS